MQVKVKAMQVKVHMLAFAEDTIREVTIPEKKGISESELLESVFYYGQNDFAIGPEKNTTCSVSAGDVVELADGRLFVTALVGFKPINAKQLEWLKAMPRRDRHFCTLVID